MSSAQANEIRQLIWQAKQNISAIGRLRNVMSRGIPRLHRSIRLPDRDREAVLTDFVLRYLDHVPNCLDALRAVTRPASIRDCTGRFLDTAADIFLKPVDSAHPRGILTLLKRAYLVHRLFEELNDRFLSRCGTPLVPVDLTQPNLLMHELIGESSANELDRRVEATVKDLLAKEDLMNRPAVCRLVEIQSSSLWYRGLEQWPSLTESLAIAFSFKGSKSRRKTPAATTIH